MRFVAGCIILSFVFLAAVPVCNFILSFFLNTTQTAAEAVTYSGNQMWAGIISETLRAIISCFIYAETKDRGISITHGIKHGLFYSALIGSLYIILGAFYFHISNVTNFIIEDSFILLVQGLANGPVFWWMYKGRVERR